MTGPLYFFRIGTDVVIIITYLVIYVFYYFHFDDGEHEQNKGKAATLSLEGLKKLFWGHTARTMWISLICTEIFLYYISVRIAKKRGIYQEFNLKEKYWRKGEEEPRHSMIKDEQKFDELRQSSNIVENTHHKHQTHEEEDLKYF